MSKEQLIRELRKAHDEIDELRTATRKRSSEDTSSVLVESLRDEIASLKAELDSLRASAGQG